MTYDPELPRGFQDADFDQAALEAAGRNASRAVRRMLALHREGRLAEAAAACPHGWGYPLASLAAVHERDPRQGERGWRCLRCGSALESDPFETLDPRVVAPCELEPRP